MALIGHKKPVESYSSKNNFPLIGKVNIIYLDEETSEIYLWNDIRYKPVAGEPYVLPVASVTKLGGVKQGEGCTISGDGTLTINFPLNSYWTTVNNYQQGLTIPVVNPNERVLFHNTANNKYYIYSFDTANPIVPKLEGEFKEGHRVVVQSGQLDPQTILKTTEVGIVQGVLKVTDYTGQGGTGTTGITDPTQTGTYNRYYDAASKQGTWVNAILEPQGTQLYGRRGSVSGIGTWEVIPTYTPYILPIASSTVLGGIKIGQNLSITPDGTLNATGGGGGGGIPDAPSDGKIYGRQNANWTNIVIDRNIQHDVHLYLDSINGSDSNDGLTASSRKKTFDSISQIMGSLRLDYGYQMFLHVYPGIYFQYVTCQIYADVLRIVGEGISTPSDITFTSNSCFNINTANSRNYIKAFWNFKCSLSTSQSLTGLCQISYSSRMNPFNNCEINGGVLFVFDSAIDYTGAPLGNVIRNNFETGLTLVRCNLYNLQGITGSSSITQSKAFSLQNCAIYTSIPNTITAQTSNLIQNCIS